MTIYLTLPSYNEQDGLPLLLDRVSALKKNHDVKIHVLVIDDGSSDGTVEVSQKHPLAAEGALDVVKHERNLGLAAGVRTSIDEFLARSSSPEDVMVMMDADDTHDPCYIPGLVEEIKKGAGLAICSRFVAGGEEKGVNAFRKLLSRGAKIFMDILAPVPGVKDISCGYRAYSRQALDRARRVYGAHLIQSSGGSVQAELLIRIMEMGEKITEIPFTLRYDLKHGPSKLGMMKTIKGYLPLRKIQLMSRMENKLMSPLMKSPPDPAGILIMTCTYNEGENITRLVRNIFDILPGASVLVVDDSSPDGTGELVKKMQKDYPGLNLLSRSGKLGLATAIIEGFKWGKEKGFKAVINMDADFSHDPVSLPAFIAKNAEYDYIVGSRYVPGGGTLNWGIHRRILSKSGNTFARFLLGVPVRDLTTGYRLIKTNKLDSLKLDTIEARGYGFLIAMTFRAARAKLRVTEIPIRFLDRQYGASKMSLNIIQEAFQLVLKLRSGKS